MGLQYDHPNFLVRREQSAVMAAAASGIVRFTVFQKARLKGCHGVVHTAGTQTGAAGGMLINQVGVATASIGTMQFDVQTHNVRSSIVMTRTLAAFDSVEFNKSTEATGVWGVMIEYEVLPDSVMS